MVALLVVSGCRLDLVTTAEVERDGSGTLALSVRLDDALLTELDDLAIDPTVEVTALASELEGWELERTVDDEAAITITLTRRFTEASEVGPALRQLSSGLADADPALLIDLDLDVADDGSARLDGAVAFRAPMTVGAEVDGEVLGPSTDELAEMTSEVVHPRLEVAMPGPVDQHDADRVDGRTLSWDISVGQARDVAARSGSPALYEQPWLWAVAGAAIAMILIVLLALRRRR